MEEYDSLLKIRIIGTDSCNKMTGGELGTHAFLEYLLKRPLFRICCILHIMESLWKRFFRLVDGESRSPTQLTGEVGKTLDNLNLRFTTIEDYETIKVDELLNVPEKVVNGLSYDQKICYHLLQAAVQGPEYFEKHPWLRTAALGKMNEARWVTLLNALLRRYFSIHRTKVTNDLKRLAHFGVCVYSKAWFDALNHPSIVDGPEVYHRLVESIRKFDRFTDKEPVLYFLPDQSDTIRNFLPDNYYLVSEEDDIASADQMATEEDQMAAEEEQVATEEDQIAPEEHERASEENEMASEEDNMTSEKDNHISGGVEMRRRHKHVYGALPCRVKLLQVEQSTSCHRTTGKGMSWFRMVHPLPR